MTVNEIKRAVDKGNRVYWSSRAYTVVKDSIGKYLIRCRLNSDCIELTHQDGITLNGKECEFFMGGKQ